MGDYGEQVKVMFELKVELLVKIMMHLMIELLVKVMHLMIELLE